MRRGQGGENVIVSNPQESPRKKKVLKSCHWAARRRRRKASDEDGRSHMSLSIHLAKLGWEKINAVWRDDHVCRVTAERRLSDGRRDDAKARKKAAKTANTDATSHDGKRRREGGGRRSKNHDTDGREQGESPPRPPSNKGRIDEREALLSDVISSSCRSSPAAADVGEGGVRDVEVVEPPKSFPARRGRRGSGGRSDVRSTTSGRVGRRNTSST